jgi:hypothetical protein
MIAAKATIKTKILDTIILYTILLITTKERKTCVMLARHSETTHDRLNRLLKYGRECKDYLTQKAIASIKARVEITGIKGWLVGDDTLINKPFSRYITTSSEQYDTVKHVAEMAICPVVLAWTDGFCTIPIAFREFCNRDVAGDQYKSKIQMMIELLNLALLYQISFTAACFDGLYATKELITYCVTNKIPFVMRMKSNSVICNNSKKASLREHPDLRLRKNNHSQKTSAFWHNIDLFFVAEKIINKNEDSKIVYVVTNIDLPAKELLSAYHQRWNIEKMFRFCKQKLGLKDCQCFAPARQSSHISLVFLSYIFIQQQRLFDKNKTLEDIQRTFCDLKYDTTTLSKSPAIRNFFAYA